MSQTLFGSNATPSLPVLDANFTDLYDLREQIKTTGYAAPSGQKFDATSGAWLLTTTTGALGYGTGSGGTVTQITSKGTAVTLNKSSGQIVMQAASLAGNANVVFGCLNSLYAATDVVVCHIAAAASSPNNYSIRTFSQGAGNIGFSLTNLTGGALAEAVTISFAIIKAVTA